jgi:hypothetical protein
MLRLNKISQWLLIAIGIAIVAMGFAYQGQAKEQEEIEKKINAELAQFETISEQPVPDPTVNLQVTLDEAQAELLEANGMFVDISQSVEISDNLYTLAGSCGLSVLEMGMTMAYKSIDEITYLVLTVTVKLEGKVAKLLAFVDKVGKEWASVEIESLEIEMADSEGEEDTASIDINIYTSEAK